MRRVRREGGFWRAAGQPWDPRSRRDAQPLEQLMVEAAPYVTHMTSALRPPLTSTSFALENWSVLSSALRSGTDASRSTRAWAMSSSVASGGARVALALRRIFPPADLRSRDAVWPFVRSLRACNAVRREVDHVGHGRSSFPRQLGAPSKLAARRQAAAMAVPCLCALTLLLCLCKLADVRVGGVFRARGSKGRPCPSPLRPPSAARPGIFTWASAAPASGVRDPSNTPIPSNTPYPYIHPLSCCIKMAKINKPGKVSPYLTTCGNGGGSGARGHGVGRAGNGQGQGQGQGPGQRLQHGRSVTYSFRMEGYSSAAIGRLHSDPLVARGAKFKASQADRQAIAGAARAERRTQDARHETVDGPYP